LAVIGGVDLLFHIASQRRRLCMTNRTAGRMASQRNQLHKGGNKP